MVDSFRAAVRPRVMREPSREVVLLEELVAELAAEGQTETLALYGPPGAGTTAALRHLQSIFGQDSGIQFVGSQFPTHIGPTWPTARIHFPVAVMPVRICRCSLRGWERDEWIEYLLAVHRDRCASVMRRIQHEPLAKQLDGNPNIWSQVLDRLATDDELDLKGALLQIIDFWYPPKVRAEVARRLASVVILRGNEQDFDQVAVDLSLAQEQSRLLFVVAIRRLLACEGAWARLEESRGRTLGRIAMRPNWPGTLIHDVGERLAQSAVSQDKLRSWLTPRFRDTHPLIVSLLHAARASWRASATGIFSRSIKSLNLVGAILDGADCQDIVMRKCNMARASFEGAQFQRAMLKEITADGTNFNNACFSNSKLFAFSVPAACFVSADFSGVTGEGVTFTKSDLSFSNFSDATFEQCSFLATDLSGATLQRADLMGCCFIGANLEDADFTNANLEYSIFTKSDLSVARLEGARFYCAELSECCLEGVNLPNADFEAALLLGAEMTGSVMPGANFSRADLRVAKLAEIDWEFADLRNANLAGATFHMGSSRSGLVGVSIPMYGSRTGFYTDELQEQDFKSPEEIRKANLRGADLRGACIDNVDFYLVDLRDALYDPEQEEQLRRTGAILYAHA